MNEINIFNDLFSIAPTKLETYYIRTAYANKIPTLDKIAEFFLVLFICTAHRPIQISVFVCCLVLTRSNQLSQYLAHESTSYW